MFTEVPFLERFAMAASAGFRAVEFQFPYEWEVSAIQDQLVKHDLESVLFNLPPGNWPNGDRGLACRPGREAEFQASVETALSYAIPFRTRILHVMAGIVPPLEERQLSDIVYISNLRYAADRCASHSDLTLVIEAINTRDVPGYYLRTQAQAHDLCQAIGRPNVRMQMDLYHMQIAEGNLTATLRDYIASCAHIQIASVPGRHEPREGEIDFRYLFRLLDDLGYQGWVGCEYTPRETTVAGLGWLDWLQE